MLGHHSGWMGTIVNGGERHEVESIGEALGVVVLSTLFMSLNSVKFCNDFIYNNPRMTPVMNAEQLFQLSALFILAVNIFIHTNEFQHIFEVVVRDSFKNQI